MNCIKFKLQKCAWLSRLLKPPPNNCPACLPFTLSPTVLLTISPKPMSILIVQRIWGKSDQIPHRNPRMVSHCIWNELKNVFMAYENFHDRISLMGPVSIHASLLHISAPRACACHMCFFCAG